MARIRRDNVVPQHYDIDLDISPSRPETKGFVSIKAEAERPTDLLTFNAAGLNIGTPHVLDHLGKPVGIRRLALDEKRERAHLQLASPVVGPLSMHMDFNGKVSEGMTGLYGIDYQDAAGADQRMLATQFETIYARRMFPCFDAPRFKADFHFRVRTPADLTVLSCADVNSVIPIGEDRQIVDFEPTPVMTSYALALIAGKLEYIEGYTKDGVRVRVYTTIGKKEEARFALKTAITALELLSEYHDFPYKKMVRKLDLVALPKFFWGAMENVGLVTFREQGLLVHPDRTPHHVLRWVVQIIVHELNHMWEGNLWSPRDWRGTWQNESFTTLLERKVAAIMFPEWNLWDAYATDVVGAALNLASLASSHAISVTKPVADQAASSLFDAISYQMGSAVTRMVEKEVGEDGLRDTLRLLCKRHAFGNARPGDVYAALEETNPGKGAAHLMRTWTKQAGCPVVVVVPGDQIGGPPDSMGLVQYRHFASRTAFFGQDPSGPVWPIPLKLAAIDLELGTMFARKAGIFEARTGALTAPDGHLPIYLNPGRTVPCRIAYSRTCWEIIVTCVEGDQIGSRVDLAMLLSDAAAMSYPGLQPISDFLSLAAVVAAKADCARMLPVWKTIKGKMGSIRNRVAGDLDVVEDIDRQIRAMLTLPLKQLGLTAKADDRPDDLILRSVLLGAGVACGHPDVIAHCLKLWESGESIDPNSQSPVFAAVAKQNGIDGLMAKLERPLSEDETRRYLYGLSCTKSPEELTRVIDYAFSGKVKQMFVFELLSNVASNPRGAKMAWETLKAKWPGIVAGKDSSVALSYLDVVECLRTQEDRDDAVTFFKANPMAGTERNISEAIESVDAALAWRDGNLESLKAWLASK